MADDPPGIVYHDFKRDLGIVPGKLGQLVGEDVRARYGAGAEGHGTGDVPFGHPHRLLQLIHLINDIGGPGKDGQGQYLGRHP